ncbi:MAG: hypothetical protein NFCOHLIN_03178 [Gammaproteobacteria bacterium]|nr:hypothetical protein [Gammaproteobacteria bacterium]
MTRDRILTLHFTDGTSMSFDFPEQTTHAVARRLKIEDFLNSSNVIVEADGSVMIFPMANIKYIQVMPPGGIPEEVLRGVQRIIAGATVV